MQMRSISDRLLKKGRKNWHEEFKKRVIMNASKAVMKQIISQVTGLSPEEIKAL